MAVSKKPGEIVLTRAKRRQSRATLLHRWTTAALDAL